MSDAWEVDVQKLTLNDLIDLQKASLDGVKDMVQLRDVLAAIVTNKTPDEIGETPLSELSTRIASIVAFINEQLELPKENTTP